MSWWMGIVWVFGIIGAMFAAAMLIGAVACLIDYLRGISDNKERIAAEAGRRFALEQRLVVVERGLRDKITYDDLRRIFRRLDEPEEKEDG